MFLYYCIGVDFLVQNRLVQSFLEDEKARELYESYLENPTTQTKDSIEKLFNIHVRKLQLLSYFSRILYFESQRYDKKIRRNNNLYQLVLDKDMNDGEGRIVDLIQGETIGENLELTASTDFTYLETIFEDKQLHNIVLNLNQKQKDLIHSLFVENRTEEEVAKKLGVTKQAVNKAKNQALKKIKQEYDKLR